MKKILIVEDEKEIAIQLAALLNNSSYEAVILKDFKNALKEILHVSPDLILLDINIPYMNGEMLLRELRKVSSTPVIMVTSKNTEIDEVLSMSFGADDYITKPYNPTILLLRIQAILRRMEGNNSNLVYKDLLLNLNKGIMVRGKQEISLTKNEMIIFSYLLNNQDRIVSRDELMTDLWNNDEYINDNALTVNMSRLRGKLKEIGYESAIETKKGLGYILQ